MLSDKKETTFSPPTPRRQRYARARQNWQCFGQPLEAPITLNSLILAVRLALPQAETDDERKSILWLLTVSETLTEILNHRP